MQGKFHSSITRVRPVFQTLLEHDRTGSSWLSRLLALPGKGSPLVCKLEADPGVLLPDVCKKRRYPDRTLRRKSYGIPAIDLEQCFEKPFPPPTRFLRWLAAHPERMTWPMDGKRRRTFGRKTQRYREELFGQPGEQAQNDAIEAALTAIERDGASRSSRKWWAFEGFTEVDCCLETNTLLLFIEGKRTEDVAPSTNWYPRRNQLLRNLEVASAIRHEKEYAVLVIAEEPLPSLTPQEVNSGLPHLSKSERDELLTHFLGCVLWQDVCRATAVDYVALPDTVEDVIAECRRIVPCVSS